MSTHTKDTDKAATETRADDPSKRNEGSSQTKKWAYPRYVFKQGTGRLVDQENNRYEAETRLVHDENELARLGDGWLNTPKEAAMSINVTNANASIIFNDDGTVFVSPKASANNPDSSGDLQRRTLIDSDEIPKPHVEDEEKKK